MATTATARVARALAGALAALDELDRAPSLLSEPLATFDADPTDCRARRPSSPVAHD